MIDLVENKKSNQSKIGLALSGGGSRAIAFHLGCLRALDKLGILKNINVISSVSGGSIIAGLYGYSNDPFPIFEKRVIEFLRVGLQFSILKRMLNPIFLLKGIIWNILSLPTLIYARIFKKRPPTRKISITNLLEHALMDVFSTLKIKDIKRENIEVIFNSCELRTGTAFRFSPTVSGSWRFGNIYDNDILVAHAITCSAAYPLFLPAIDENFSFIKNGITKSERVILTDGGVYENLGISCLEPNCNLDFSLHSFRTDYIICCNAGHGQFSGNIHPYGFFSRISMVFRNIFRKVQDAGMNRLHEYKNNGLIKGFAMPYLGQNDELLPYLPADFVHKEQVENYPTNFAAMDEKSIELLGKRGEQLTEILIKTYCKELLFNSSDMDLGTLYILD